MKLLICIVNDNDVSALSEDLINANFRITKLPSTGGFLKSGNTTLLLGMNEERVPEAVKIIEDNCKKRTEISPIINTNMDATMYQPFPIEVQVGGATVFEINVDNLYRL